MMRAHAEWKVMIVPVVQYSTFSEYESEYKDILTDISIIKCTEV